MQYVFFPFPREHSLRTRFQIEISGILFHLLSPYLVAVWPRTSGSRPGDGFEGHLGDSIYHGESESGHSSPGGWGSGSEEDDEEDASEQDDEQSEGSAQPICVEGGPPLFWSENVPQPAAVGGDEHIDGEEYAAAAEAFGDEMHSAAAPRAPKIYASLESLYIRRLALPLLQEISKIYSVLNLQVIWIFFTSVFRQFGQLNC
jgi:hypothetical protein